MSSRTPISIEALLAKQKAAELEAAKPKFLSKAERAKIALAKRVAEVESIKNVQVARDIARDDLIKKGAEAGREMGYNNYNRDGNYSRDGGLNYGNSNLNGRNGGGYGNSRGGSRNNNYDNRSNNNNNRNRPGIGIDKRNESQNNQRDMGGIPTGPRGNSAKEEIKLESTPMEIDSIKSEEKSEIKLEFDSKPPLPFNAPPPPPPPPSDMPPPPPPSSLPPPPPLVKLTLAEMAESQAKLMSISSIPAPLNSTLNGLRYLGEKAIDKRKSRKISDKKFIFDWDKMDDTGAGEVDPIYAPYIPKSLTKVDKNGRGYGIGKDDRVKGGGNGVGNIEGMINKVGMYGRGMLAGFDRELTETKAKGPIDERHWSEKLLIEMKDRDWRIFREDFSISTRGGSIPLPLRNWSESNIPQQILDVIEEIGYNEPSPIQRQSIPIGLMNRDQIGVAETGSGKTAAFVVPMLAYISRLPPLSDENRLKGPYALVLAPTRELAQQIETETNKFTKLLGYKCVSIVGGRAIEEQQFNMKDGAEIIIATPGRLKDCLERSILVLSQCTYVVMDEADRMVSLGFEEVINFILDALPVTNLKPDSLELEDEKKMNLILSNSDDDDNLIDTSIALYRQTVMFSATMPAAVERLAKKYLRRPAIVTIGIAGQAVDTVDQRVEFISGDDKKKKRLIEILNSGEFQPPMIIFVNQKKGADVLMKDLVRAQWNVTTLHSGKNQEQREAALNSIRNKECDVLVATDLAGRGIDVSDVSLVVNFQMANNIEAYVHRIGRTGRAGKTGTAITFLNDADEELMYDLKTLISKSPVSKLPNELLRHPAAQTKLSSSMKRRAGEIED